MGRYNNNLKCAQLRKLLDERKYKQAYQILETIDVDKVRLVTDLDAFAEVYRKAGQYDDARQMLLRVLEQFPSRRVYYKLACVAILQEDFEGAEVYYEDYKAVAPDTEERYVLRYRLDRAKGESYEVRIKDLEELKRFDYIEEWGYELAKLYHKAGMREKCVEECNDLVLWFGEGVIVEKAKMLRAYYLEDSASVLGKYGADLEKARERARRGEEQALNLRMDTRELGSQIAEFAEEDKQDELRRELEDELKPTMDLQAAMKRDMGLSDTANIQAEIAKYLAEKESYDEEEEEEEGMWFFGRGKKNKNRKEDNKSSSKETSGDSIDYEESIEKLNQSATKVLEKVSKDDGRTADAMDQSTRTFERPAAEWKNNVAKEPAYSQGRPVRTRKEPEYSQEIPVQTQREPAYSQEIPAQAQKKSAISDLIVKKSSNQDSSVIPISEIQEALKGMHMRGGEQGFKEIDTSQLPNRAIRMAADAHSAEASSPVEIKIHYGERYKDFVKEEELPNLGKTNEDEMGAANEDAAGYDDLPEISGLDELFSEEPEDVIIEGINLTEEFGAFMLSDSYRDQIIQLVEELMKKDRLDSHIMITGEAKTGKTTLAKSIARILSEKKPNSRITTPRGISADRFNTMTSRDRFEKHMPDLKNCCLIVDHAGDMYVPTVKNLITAMKEYEGEILVILEDSQSQMERLLLENYQLSEYMKHIIKL